MNIPYVKKYDFSRNGRFLGRSEEVVGLRL